MILDFECSNLIYDRHNKKGGGTKYNSITYCRGLKGFYMDNLKTLFYTILTLAGIKLPWENDYDMNKKLKYDEIRVNYKHQITQKPNVQTCYRTS